MRLTMRLTLVGAGASVFLSSHAMGQIAGEASWVWEVTTQDGDSVVEPGETAIVDLSIDMEPDVFTGPGGPPIVLGLFLAQWDMLGQQNSSNGMIVDWTAPLDSVAASESDGTNITGLVAFQTGSPDTFLHDDPIHVLTFEWAPATVGTYGVEYITSTLNDSVSVLTGTIAFDDLVAEEWSVNDAIVPFQVVPSPTSLTLYICAAAGAAVSRRR